MSDHTAPEPEDRVEARPSIPGQRPPEAPISGTGAPALPAGGGKKASRWKTALIVIAGVLALLCVGGLGSAYFYYRKVSEPDRSTPGVVVRQYLQATFDNRDSTEAARYTCGSPRDIAAVQQLLADVTSREKQYDIRITVRWEDFSPQINDGRSTVDLRMKISVPEESGGSSESIQQWSFDLRRRDGWRVCNAHRVS